jgi:hypothetical protein
MKILARYKIGTHRPDAISVESIFACKKAAESFLKIGEFKKSILYYDSCSTKYKGNYLQCGLGVMIDNAYRDKDLFFAYLGLNDNDKALELATPYFFDTTMTEFIDSNYSKEYFNAVGKIYSKSEAKEKIDKALDTLNQKLTRLYSANLDSLPTDNWIILFRGKFDILQEESRGGNMKIYRDFYTKDYFINRIKTSVGYRFYNPEK